MADVVVFAGDVSYGKYSKCKLKVTSEELILIPQTPHKSSVGEWHKYLALDGLFSAPPLASSSSPSTSPISSSLDSTSPSASTPSELPSYLLSTFVHLYLDLPLSMSLALSTSSTSQAHIVHLADVFAVVPDDRPNSKSFHVHSLKEGKEFKRTHVVDTFTCDSHEAAQHWITVLRSVLAGVNIGDPIPKRKILILINPFGGRKKAPIIYERIIAPIFRLAGLEVEVVPTQYAGHATEIGQTFDVTKYDGLCTISGDGLLHELVQGIMRRPDWDAALNVPMGIIPGGSGNGLARSLHTPTPLAAALNIVKGHTRQVDLSSAVQKGAPVRYAFLAYFWGLVADIDIESEKYRWAGPARFTMSGVARVLNLRKYRGRLSFLPWIEGEPVAKRESSVDHSGPKRLYTVESIAENKDKWVTIEDDFILIMAVNVPWVAIDAFFGPYSDMSDGAIDLTFATKTATTTKILPMFLDTTSPKFAHHPNMTYVKVKAFYLEPLTPRGIMDVDGEHVPNEPILVESIPRAAKVFAPSNLSLPHYPISERPVYPDLFKTPPAAPQAQPADAAAAAAAPVPAAAPAAVPADSEAHTSEV